MDESGLRSRQKVASKAKDKGSAQEDSEEMLLKNRKQVAQNYDFGDAQKLPTNIQDIIEKKFLRIFIWELFFGEIRFRFLLINKTLVFTCLGYIFWSIFFGIGPMVMFFPMVKLAIHGYEILVLSLASPIILNLSFLNSIAEVSFFFKFVFLIKYLAICV